MTAKTVARIALGLIFLGGLLWALLGRSSEAPAPVEGIVPGSVAYEVAWALGGATFRPGGGFEVTTDQGVRVEVDELTVVPFSATLVPCVTEPGRPVAALLWESAVALLGVPAARAGHSLAADPAQVEAPTVFGFQVDRPAVLGQRTLGGQTRYCRVHWLIARAPGDGPHRPADAAMIGKSLHLVGRALGKDGQVKPLVLDASMANGTFGELPALSDGAPLTLRWILSVDHLFDSLDFTERDAVVARRVLGRLVETARVERR